MPKTTIFLASRTEQDNFLLHKKLEPLTEEFQDLRFQGLNPLALASSLDSSAALIVINVAEWTAREWVYLDDIAKAGYQGHVLIIAKADAKVASKSIQEQESVVFLEKPFDTKDLVGIARKMLTARAVAQRIHRRFDTSQEAEVELFNRSGKFNSRVRNLSKGGAFVELMSPGSLSVGELVRLRMELKDVNRTYTLPAKVVWTTRATNENKAGIGVEFVGPGDVQKLILGF